MRAFHSSIKPTADRRAFPDLPGPAKYWVWKRIAQNSLVWIDSLTKYCDEDELPKLWTLADAVRACQLEKATVIVGLVPQPQLLGRPQTTNGSGRDSALRSC